MFTCVHSVPSHRLAQSGFHGFCGTQFFLLLIFLQICLLFRKTMSSSCTKYKENRKYHINTMLNHKYIMEISWKIVSILHYIMRRTVSLLYNTAMKKVFCTTKTHCNLWASRLPWWKS